MVNFLLQKTQSFYNGRWQNGLAGKMPVFNPANQQEIGTVSLLSQEQCLAAIDAANTAFETWRFSQSAERSKFLWAWHGALLKNKQAIAEIITLENGKPLAQALGEVDYAADFVAFYAEECKRIYGEIFPSGLPNRDIIVKRVPVGVVGAITPWNFPVGMITRKVAPALAYGCTVVLKPSPETPFSALAMAYLAEECKFPKGIFNVVLGEAPMIGELFCTHPKIAKIAFTGSTATGKWLSAHAGDHLKKLSMELGGNAPFIICEDAKLEDVIPAVMHAKFRNSGQACTCVNRIYVHESLYTHFIEALQYAMDDLIIGDGFTDDVTIGPLITERAVKNSKRLVEDAIAQGAILKKGGKPSQSGKQFFEPTLLVDVPETAACIQEEIFAPIAAVSSFKNDDDVLKRANDTVYGLAAYVYTQSPIKARFFSDRLEYGMVGINLANLANAFAPFGGVKHSGSGREGSHYAIESFTDVKQISYGF